MLLFTYTFTLATHTHTHTHMHTHCIGEEKEESETRATEELGKVDNHTVCIQVNKTFSKNVQGCRDGSAKNHSN